MHNINIHVYIYKLHTFEQTLHLKQISPYYVGNSCMQLFLSQHGRRSYVESGIWWIRVEVASSATAIAP